MTLVTARSDDDVDRLVHSLLAPDRAIPHVVLSTPLESTSPLIDARALADDLADLAAVTVVPTGHLTWRLSAQLPDRCGVWGGAGRVYPVGDSWLRDPLRSPLRFVYSAPDAARAAQQLFDDAVAMSAATGSTTFVASPRWDQVDAVVQGVIAKTRALLRTSSGGLATISAELTFPGIPIDWYLQKGQRVHGRLDPRNHLLHVEVPEVDGRSLLARFPVGAVTLALVDEVDDETATLLLHPRVRIVVRREQVSSNPLDSVGELVQRGEVLPVRIAVADGGGLGLRLHDVDDEEPVEPSVALLAAGPPWLVAGRDLVVSEPEVVPDSMPAALPPEAAVPEAAVAPPPRGRPVPGPGPRQAARRPRAEPAGEAPKAAAQSATLQQVQLALEAARAEIRRLQSRAASSSAEQTLRLLLGQEQARTARLSSEIAVLTRTTADLKKRARNAGSTTRSAIASRDRFDDLDDWIRHEVHLTWIERFDAGERRRRPLGTAWTLGPRFASSLDGLTDAQLRKVFRAVVDVVLGLDAVLDGRELHRLRSGTGGGDAPVERVEDGASAWRIAIERNVPAALRLHYWRTRDLVELARVAQHDDFGI